MTIFVRTCWPQGACNRRQDGEEDEEEEDEEDGQDVEGGGEQAMVMRGRACSDERASRKAVGVFRSGPPVRNLAASIIEEAPAAAAMLTDVIAAKMMMMMMMW
mmetsp:Transcript_55122/g.117633  ORF Transcript_55122/g.117633 Transcript_55122/m.117633 type:complete len:103 (-) Transcript_55122:5-313(-)